MYLLTAFTILFSQPLPADSSALHSIEAITVSAPLKQSGPYGQQPLASTTITMSFMEANRIEEPKDLSLTVPNMLHADYGSKMTSSIYVRGIGARMDQPAMGLYIDNIPILNKNNYDIDYFDLRRIDVLRGPQGTLYGRNTIGGVIDVRTLSPMDYRGTRLSAGYSNGNSWQLSASSYMRPSDNSGISLAVSHRRTDGFFTNTYNGSAADRLRSTAARFKFGAALGSDWSAEASLYANLVSQNGFAYSPYDIETGQAAPINHNDPCSYDRAGLIGGLTFMYGGSNLLFSSTTSYQYTDDEMVLDQDFSPASIFTLRQKQRERALTQEFVARSATTGRWEWITGAFGFYKHNHMEAPVTFKRDGIDQLILANANAGIHTIFPDANLLIEEDRFPIESSFELPAWGASLYHQSSLKAGHWKFTAGLRADYEHTAIRYANSAEIHYRFSVTMPDYKPLPVKMNGRQHKSFLEVMPKVSALYETGAGIIYFTAARGYKAGGFNTQIFSDLLQNRMMNAMMSDLGVYFEGYEPGYDVESAISYKPESSWNYEAGGHFTLLDGKLQLDAALFWIDCRNQQLTVFPPGKSTGRLMSNAGRTRSLGAELTADYRYKKFRAIISYGHTEARFLAYDNGQQDFSGNRVPYAPANTLSANFSYRFELGGRGTETILLNAGYSGAGRIYWDEGNTLSQPFYGLLSASVTIKKGGLSLCLWGKNLTGTSYNTFYFKSMGNSFVQRGKPVQAGITIACNF